ncbi:hypothetical protein, partial [Burkholderia thailandensis]|uniref:hypothetical protein n=1 Tax=Burkholderia thailandensis TaxID=57975 RepID=UPI001CA507F9
ARSIADAMPPDIAPSAGCALLSRAPIERALRTRTCRQRVVSFWIGDKRPKWDRITKTQIVKN